MNEELKIIIQYRLDKAEETLSDTQVLFDLEKFGSCINRLYYAAFYSLNALLLSHNLTSKTHKGVRNLFLIEFVNKGLIAKEWSTFYSLLFNSRMECDYKDLYVPDPEIIREWLDKSYQFLDLIKGLIKF
ncbi:MAG: HEPN domain-containing protein [bacterium]